jgi:hypothetical protein
VEGLVIRCEAGLEPSDDPAHAIEVDFDGRQPVDVRIMVSSDDQKIASDVMSVAEEQVERTLEVGLAYRVLRLDFPFVVFVGMMLVAGLTASVAGLSTSGDPEIVKSMWLTPGDLAEIRPIVQNTETLAPEQATGILTRQLKNVIAQQNPSSLGFLTDWRAIVVLLPAIIAVVSLVALAYCYPRAVFLWGDAEEWYRKLLARRGLIWNVVLATLVLGIITNLAVFAFGSLITGPRL